MPIMYITFAISALIVIIAGNQLSKYGDVIASRTSLGEGIVGGVLIAAATSLPELVTSVSATLMDAPDIAIGNVYGSNTFNLMILALADIYHGPGRLLWQVRMNHILSGLFGILLSALGALGILISQVGTVEVTVGWVSMSSFMILIAYALGSVLVLRYEEKTKERAPKEMEEVSEEGNISLKRAVIGFGIAATFIVWAGMTLSKTGDQIALETGLGRTFVGTLLVAATTSLPELVATMAAIKIGSYDMAVGNIFGSNVFNMLIIIVSDLVYYKQSIFSAVSITHSVTAMAGIILSAIALVGLFYRSKRTIFTIGWDSVFILLMYLWSVYLIFSMP